MKKIIVVVVFLVLVLGDLAPALAQSGCERAGECGYHVASQGWYPEGIDPSIGALIVWNPGTGNYEGASAYSLAALCYQYGGYYYLDYGGEYWHYC